MSLKRLEKTGVVAVEELEGDSWDCAMLNGRTMMLADAVELVDCSRG